MTRGALAVMLSCTCVVAGCDGDQPKVAPDRRDIDQLVTAVSDVVTQCQAVEAGYVTRVEVASVRRDVDHLVDAAERLRAESRFATRAGVSTVGRQVRLALRRLRGCAPAQAVRLEDALDD
jgi:hypothetical protein